MASATSRDHKCALELLSADLDTCGITLSNAAIALKQDEDMLRATGLASQFEKMRVVEANDHQLAVWVSNGSRGRRPEPAVFEPQAETHEDSSPAANTSPRDNASPPRERNPSSGEQTLQPSSARARSRIPEPPNALRQDRLRAAQERGDVVLTPSPPEQQNMNMPPPNVGAAICASFSKRGTCRKFQEFGQCSFAHPSNAIPISTLSSNQKGECISCMEPSAGLIKAACGHLYCKPCLEQLFEKASHDETLLPVRCCKQAMDQSLANVVLSKDNAQRFMVRLAEHSASRKMYCPDPRCSTFIDLSHTTSDEVSCSGCYQTLCTLCKSVAHPTNPCAVPHETQALQALAKSEGWMQCKCGHMVQLAHGCNHMTCICGHHFCYECGVEWKKCQCSQWQDDLLRNAAERQVRNAVAPRVLQAMAGLQRRQLVQEAADHLRDHHDCQHRNWSQSNRCGRTCANCTFYLNCYSYVCGDCDDCVPNMPFSQDALR